MRFAGFAEVKTSQYTNVEHCTYIGEPWLYTAVISLFDPIALF